MMTERVELARLAHRIVVDVEIGVDARPRVVVRSDALQVHPRQTRDGDDVGSQRLLDLRDRRLQQLELCASAVVITAIVGGDRRQTSGHESSSGSER